MDIKRSIDMTIVQPYACLQDVVVVKKILVGGFKIELLHRGWIFNGSILPYRLDSNIKPIIQRKS